MKCESSRLQAERARPKDAIRAVRQSRGRQREESEQNKRASNKTIRKFNREMTKLKGQMSNPITYGRRRSCQDKVPKGSIVSRHHSQKNCDFATTCKPTAHHNISRSTSSNQKVSVSTPQATAKENTSQRTTFVCVRYNGRKQSVECCTAIIAEYILPV